jgi:hypothetical protein
VGNGRSIIIIIIIMYGLFNDTVSSSDYITSNESVREE